MPNFPMERKDIIDALSELITLLKTSKTKVKIRVVGGAALSLRYFNRLATTDIDSLDFTTGDHETVQDAILLVGRNLGLPLDWLNTEVSKIDAFPTVGKEVHWETIFSESGIEIAVPSAEVLLVMKLKANRPGRDTDDIRKLITQIGFTDLAQVEQLFEDYYPGEILSSRASKTTKEIISEKKTDAPIFPPPPFGEQ